MAPVTVDVERLTYGFDALAHHDGQVLFLPYAAPGDQVSAKIVAQKRDYLRGEILTVLASGPDRVTPPCPHFGVCGGCQWQHVAIAAQRAAKTRIVREHLLRSGQPADLEVAPILTADQAWGYRGRLALVVEGRGLGFHQRGSHRLVPVTACAIAAPALEAHLPHARAWIAALRAVVRRVTIAAVAGGVVLVADTSTNPGEHDEDASAALCARIATVRGAVLVGPTHRRVVGDPTVRVEVEPDCALDVPADCFTQVNPGANQLLVATVCAFVGPVAGSAVLDGYCGAGNFTVPLARRGAHMVGIERVPLAVEALRANAQRLHLPNIETHQGDTTTFARSLTPHSFAAIVIDPPRAGAAQAVAPLAALKAPRLVYVSCDPATLARDVAQFTQHGYRLARVQPIDLFPQTFHVETVVELLLT